MKLLKYIITIIIVYLFVYNPTFSFVGEMGSIKLLYLLCFIYVFINKETIPVLIKKYKTESYFFLSFIIFAAIRTLMGGDSVELYKHVVFYIEAFFLPIFILSLLYNNFNLFNDRIIRVFLITGSVAAIISTLCIINPAINAFVKFELQLIDRNESVYDALNRGFGLGESLTFSYGIVQGFILGLGILNIKQNKWFIFFIPSFIASILLNARTGIFLPVAVIVIYLLFNRSAKNIVSIGMGGIITYFLILYLLQSFNLNDDQQSFIDDFSKQLVEANESGIRNDRGTIGILVTEHVVLPTTLDEWFLGKGYLIFRVHGISNSDSGFFQQLNYGGVSYSLLMIAFIVFIMRRMKKARIRKEYIYFFIVTIIIAHFKGNFIMNSGGFRLIMLLYFGLTFLASQRKLLLKNSDEQTLKV